MGNVYDRWTGNVELEQDLNHPDLFLLKSTILYRSIDDILYTVEPGWHTDGGSIPRSFWRLLGPPIRHPGLRAFILHDILYKSHKVNKKVADEILYEALINCGISKWKAILINAGLYIGGGTAYDSYDYRAQKRHEQYIHVSR